MNRPLNTVLALTTLSLALAACGDLPLPGGTPTAATSGTGTGGTSTPATSSGGTSSGGTSTPAPAPNLSITGKNVLSHGITYWGGGPVTFSVQNIPAGAQLSWTASAGDLAQNEGGSATFPYNASNRIALDGSSDTVVTVTLTTPNGVITLRQALRLDDQAPLANGGVSVTQGGKTFLLGSGGTFLNASATFNLAYQDAGVGLSKVILSAYRGGAPVQDNVTGTAGLPEAGGYTLQASPVADLLGNTVTAGGTLGGGFAVDATPPLISADRASGATLNPPTGTGTGGTSSGGTSSGGTSTGGTSNGGSVDTLTFTATDPTLADSSPGSGLASLAITPAGNVQGNVATVTWTQLRAAGVKGQSATVTVVATDRAGNAISFPLTVTLP